jgi:2-oxoglutarate dehydrogenase complex dehydrogenase (E1) component-like enzyme
MSKIKQKNQEELLEEMIEVEMFNLTKEQMQTQINAGVSSIYIAEQKLILEKLYCLKSILETSNIDTEGTVIGSEQILK